MLNQAVKRNIDRFPGDFMFQLTQKEMDNWKSQIVTLNADIPRSQNVILKRGENIKYLPHAFTQEGVAMLSSVLRSKKAIQVNIQMMRVFIKFRELVPTNEVLKKKIGQLEKKYESHDKEIKFVFEVIKQLLNPPLPPEKPKKKIGFKAKG